MSATRTVPCAECDGLTFVLVDCVCRCGGDTVLVTEESWGSSREPYRECQVCQGSGAQAHECFSCFGHGRRRAELALTVVNLATGRAASSLAGVGSLPVRRGKGRRHYLDGGPLIGSLAERVGLTVEDLSARDTVDTSLAIVLPDRYDPAAPAEERRPMEAAAIAAAAGPLPWRVFAARPGDRGGGRGARDAVRGRRAATSRPGHRAARR